MHRLVTVGMQLFVAVQLLALQAPPAEAATAVSVPSGPGYGQLLSQVSPGAQKKGGFVPNFGNYFDASNPGWGLDIQAVGNFIFAVWFTYRPDGSPTWYVIVDELAAKGDGMSITGNIESFKWDPFGDPGSQAVATVVGTMTIDWSDASNADVAWTLNGEDGSASVSFARFAPPPTPANMTGHYFDPLRPGWGFTLLTQGEVTVMTVYWYKDGQPVWAQGVETNGGFFNFLPLLYFNGPGLCPSCLGKQDAKGELTTEPVSNLMFYNWALDDPPVVSFGETVSAPPDLEGDGPLGPEPYGDIELPTVAEAITSVAGNSFDPDYTWFLDAIAGIDGAKGPGCLPFEYDTGIFDASPTKKLETAYFMLTPVDGFFPMYMDSDCTQPWNFTLQNATDVDPMQSGLMLAWTGEDGVIYKWSARFAFKALASWGAKQEFISEQGVQGEISVPQPLDAKGMQFDIRWYGVSHFRLNNFAGERGFSLIAARSGNSLNNIELFPDLDLFARFVYP